MTNPSVSQEQLPEPDTLPPVPPEYNTAVELEADLVGSGLQGADVVTVETPEARALRIASQLSPDTAYKGTNVDKRRLSSAAQALAAQRALADRLSAANAESPTKAPDSVSDKLASTGFMSAIRRRLGK